MKQENKKLDILVSRIRNAPCFAIFGAQIVAYGAYVALKSLYGITPMYFIVSNLDGNPTEIDDIKVETLDTCKLDAKSTLILIGVTELLQDEICSGLNACGFTNNIRFGSTEEHLLMLGYFNSIGKFPLLEGKPEDSKDLDIAIYEAKNHRDKPLSNYPMPKHWEHSIQIGTALTAERISPLLDNIGDNISDKNHMFCEMSATYWVWKNTSHDWKGICHYRRHLNITSEQMRTLEDGEVDAILPLPYICYPNTLSHFRRYISNDVVNIMLKALEALFPNNYEKYIKIINGKYQYSYNMLCGKRQVFDDYCSWIFSVLEYMELSGNNILEKANTRVLAYSAEVLTSIYFMANSDKLNIRHVEKMIYV